QPVLGVDNLDPDEQRTLCLLPLEVEHADKVPLARGVEQAHGGDGKDGVRRPRVVALDEHAQKDERVVVVLPLEHLVPDGVVGGRVLVVLVQEAELVLPVAGRLALGRLARQVVWVHEGAGLDVVGGTAVGERHVRGAGDVKTQLLPAVLVGELSVASRSNGGRFEDIAIGAAEEGFVDLHGGAKGLPVEGADLGADSPEGHGLEVARRDARALGVDAHEMAGIVVGNVGALRRQVGTEARLGHVDEVVVGADKLAAGVEPRVLGNDDGGGGGRVLLLVPDLAGGLFVRVLVLVIAAAAAAAVRVSLLVGVVVLDNDGNLGAQLGEGDVFAGPFLLAVALFADGLAQEAVAEDLLHNLDETALTMGVTVILEGEDDGSRLPSGLGVFPGLLCFFIMHIADGLTDGAEGNVGGQRPAVCDLWLVLVVAVVPSVNLYAARSRLEGRLVRRRTRVSVKLVCQERVGSVGDLGGDPDVRSHDEVAQSWSDDVFSLEVNIARGQDAVLDNVGLEGMADAEVVLEGRVASAVASAGEGAVAHLLAVVFCVVLMGAGCKGVQLGHARGGSGQR
ncbi:hypothetical protein BN1723_011493, partial [Verticillium longisporum]